MKTEYTLDPSDRLVAVDERWIAFAEANGAAALADRVLGETLWAFMASATLRELYRRVLTRVRSTGNQVTLPFRCDSPTLRRFMLLSIGPALGPHGTLSFKATLLRVEPQPATASAFYAARDAATGDATTPDVLVMCSTCKRLEIDGWHEIDQAIARGADLLTEPVRPISHGLCPICCDMMLATLS